MSDGGYSGFSMLLRVTLLEILSRLGLVKRWKMYERANMLHIGLSGHVSVLDRNAAENQSFTPLTGILLWLMQPYIDYQRRFRQAAFRDSVQEILGEHPDDWTTL